MNDYSARYDNIVSNINNDVIFNNILLYIKSYCKVSINEIEKNCNFYVKEMLNSINKANERAELLRIRRDKLAENLEVLNRAYANADNCGGSEQGFSNGGKPNNVELRMIKRIELREGIEDSINEIMLLQKSLYENNDKITEMINLIPQRNYALVLQLVYIDCYCRGQIADKLSYSPESVSKLRIRGISVISKLLVRYIKKIQSAPTCPVKL